MRAFDRVRRRRPARLILLGEGKCRGELEALRRELGLEDIVDLPGWTKNPLSWIVRSALLAQSSTFEGLPTVLVEALACGTPVVATRCSGGSVEILEDGRYGRLVPVGDVAAMADAILAALEAPTDRAALRARGADFTVERSVAEYRRILRRGEAAQ
jgi:glycosyltransferase involved in cell wall biosynthesis